MASKATADSGEGVPVAASTTDQCVLGKLPGCPGDLVVSVIQTFRSQDYRQRPPCYNRIGSDGLGLVTLSTTDGLGVEFGLQIGHHLSQRGLHFAAFRSRQEVRDVRRVVLLTGGQRLAAFAQHFFDMVDADRVAARQQEGLTRNVRLSSATSIASWTPGVQMTLSPSTSGDSR